MRKPLSKLPDEKAQKELKQFLLVGYACAVIAFFIFGFLAVVGLAAGARCLMLTSHEANKKRENLNQLRVASIALLLVSALELILYWSRA